ETFPSRRSAAIHDVGRAGSCRSSTTGVSSCVSPIGRPALEIVTPDSQPFHAREVEASQNRQAVGSGTRGREVAMITTQRSERRQHTAELLEHRRRLLQALSALCLVSERVRASAQLAVEDARAATQRTRRQGRGKSDWFVPKVT